MTLTLDTKLRIGMQTIHRRTEPATGAWHPRIDELVALVELVDRCGYDSLWVGDHVSFAVSILDPLLQLAQAAVASRRLTLGTSVYLLPLRHPAPVAKQVATLDHIFGYVNFIDGSARGLPSTGFFAMKSRATFCPIGPYLVTKDEIADPQNLPVKLTVNGELKQDFNTNDMAHNIARCIEWASSVHTLEPGDILATGTNHRGLSSFMDGDKVALEVQGLGKLEFNVRDSVQPARKWLRETRQDRKEKGQDGPTPQVSGKYAPGA